MTDELHGHCFCREVRYRVTGVIRTPCFCHCESCRRASGSVFVAWGAVDRGDFRVTHGELSIINSSSEVERGFCGACGTALTYRHARRSDELDITLVSLEDPSVVRPQAHIWLQDRLPWVKIDDGLPRYETVPGGSV